MTEILNIIESALNLAGYKIVNKQTNKMTIIGKNHDGSEFELNLTDISDENMSCLPF